MEEYASLTVTLNYKISFAGLISASNYSYVKRTPKIYGNGIYSHFGSLPLYTILEKIKGKYEVAGSSERILPVKEKIKVGNMKKLVVVEEAAKKVIEK